MKISPEQTRLHSLTSPVRKSIGETQETLEVKKHRLRKATKEFESFFILHMLKAMRKTVPKSEFLGGGLGQDIYTSMFDEELARKVAGTGPGSIADMLYRSLEKHLEVAENPAQNQDAGDVPASTSLSDQKRVPPVTSNQKHPRSQPANTDHDRAGPGDPDPAQRSITYRPKVTADPILKEYGPTIDKAARQYDLDPHLIYSVIAAESAGQSDAVSSKGARGLMQLIDSTAAEMGVSDSLDPHQNIMGGAKYLRQLLDKFRGNLRLALAAYNAGPSAVSKYNGVPPFRETHRYIENVLGKLHGAKKL